MTVKSSDLFPESFNEAFRDIAEHKHELYVFSGGRGSCKSSFISISIVSLIVNNPLVNAAVFRKYSYTLRGSVYEQVKWAIRKLGLTSLFRSYLAPLKVVYSPTGQEIIFSGIDDPERLKSVKSVTGYFGVLWFEELTEFTPSEVSNVELSFMRGGGVFWRFESYNPPSSARNWVNRVKDSPITYRHLSCYLDVPREWLGEPFFAEADRIKAQNEKVYRNVFLGEPTGTGRGVFENVILRSIDDKEINTMQFFYYGIDWGFFPDPFVFVECSYNARTRTVFIIDELKLSKYGNFDAFNRLKLKLGDRMPTSRIVADSAEPKSISDFKFYGANIVGAVKGRGSRDLGFKWLQTRNSIVIDRDRCPESADEFSLFEYEIDKKTGAVMEGIPDGQADHAIDAVRYALEDVIRRVGR